MSKKQKIRTGDRKSGDRNAKKFNFTSKTKNKGLKWHSLLKGLTTPH